MVEPGLRVYKIYSGYRFFGRPTVEELRLDLRVVLQRCRPDWDISSADPRTAWAKGEKASFYPYGKTRAQVLANRIAGVRSRLGSWGSLRHAKHFRERMRRTPPEPVAPRILWSGSVILAVNSGSSSVKAALFSYAAQPALLARTSIEGRAAACLPTLIDWITRDVARGPLRAIGHRLVHGGMAHVAPERITAALIVDLNALVPFAPNHLPDEIALLSALREYAPDVPHVACFDTAFHQGMPGIARRLPIPREFHDRGIRRYGFHGLSYEYLMEELARIAGTRVATGRVIVAHLGSGSSLAAIANNRSIDTTMAFTPIGGVVMSTRSGDLDPGVVTYLGREHGLSPAQVEDVLSRQSGLLAIAGDTGDMQTLLGRPDEASRLAVESYVYSVAKAVGALAAALEGVETVVFSGGIGQHASGVRAAICQRLGFVGIELDPAANNHHAAIISATSSRVTVRVIATDEEQMIARSTYRLVATG